MPCRVAASITAGTTEGDTTKRAPASTARSTSSAVRTVPIPRSVPSGTVAARRSTTSRAPCVVMVSSRLRMPFCRSTSTTASAREAFSARRIATTRVVARASLIGTRADAGAGSSAALTWRSSPSRCWARRRHAADVTGGSRTPQAGRAGRSHPGAVSGGGVVYTPERRSPVASARPTTRPQLRLVARRRPPGCAGGVHVMPCDLAGGVQTEELEAALVLGPQDLDRPFHAPFAAGHEPVQVGPSGHDRVGPERERGDDVLPVGHTAVQDDGDVGPHRRPNGRQHVQRGRGAVQLAPAVVG